ncbi:hypothetical protein C672_0592 [[Clostridium] bifermentans ATCC 638]|uniref:Uncharacterized protein n=1 Tax=Paraclostridium bifermentans ATCC 638 = DSM 14991 TaxID=1233171 RepID=T4VK18_PARBF|nr:hypothetical protein [Paraclostridium bifermentans]EQK44064.1 hypothetical protein C672_0592 [[Clostridium] bifermentans ATCC 638] [Paraclostridium bifermentans ATCC 638 = DSM 14991]RIZ58532.1 hypothetical protein CHH45_10505 [Paraclostridium bifermentans]UAG19804.1 hypothetical protein KXZ80_16705 [Paraclostridium bifermentans]
MLNYSENQASVNKYALKTLKVFNIFDSPKFTLGLSNISKVFRSILLALLGFVEPPISHKYNL